MKQYKNSKASITILTNQMGQEENTQSKVDKLVAWCKSQGTKVDPNLSFEYSFEKGISTLYTPTSDQVSSRKDVEVQLKIPRKIIISSQNARKYFLSLAPDFEWSQFESRHLLTAYLAFRLGDPESINDPYLDLLPKAEEIRSPLIYNEDELLLLKGTNLFKGTQVVLAQVKREYQEFIDATKSVLSKTISFHDYLWGFLILYSRSFPLRLVEKECDPAEVMLVPLLDFMNHKPLTKVTWSFDGTSFGVSSQIELANGSGKYEVYNNYGPKGNEELLMAYGFVIPGNEFDILQLAINWKQLSTVLEGVDIHKWGIKKIYHSSDLTYNVIQSGSVNDEVSSRAEAHSNVSPKEDAFFICNRDHPLPEGMIQLFALVSRRDDEEGLTLRNVLNGVNSVRESIDIRFKGQLNVIPKKADDVAQINYDNCKIYREGQLELYNMTKHALKEKEKVLLKQYRTHLITLKDILKKDMEGFENFVVLFEFISSLSQEFYQEVLMQVWILKTVNYHYNDTDSTDIPLKALWVVDEFKRLEKSEYEPEKDETLCNVYNETIGKMLVQEELKDVLFKGEHWDVKSFMLAGAVSEQNRYLKGSKRDMILIAPLPIDEV